MLLAGQHTRPRFQSRIEAPETGRRWRSIPAKPATSGLSVDAKLAAEAVTEAGGILRPADPAHLSLAYLLTQLRDRLAERAAALRAKATELEASAALARTGFPP